MYKIEECWRILQMNHMMMKEMKKKFHFNLLNSSFLAKHSLNNFLTFILKFRSENWLTKKWRRTFFFLVLFNSLFLTIDDHVKNDDYCFFNGTKNKNCCFKFNIQHTIISTLVLNSLIFYVPFQIVVNVCFTLVRRLLIDMKRSENIRRNEENSCWN